MSGTVKSWLMSGGSMLAGMACVIATWSLVPQEDDKTVQNKIRFSELSGQEQADLRNKAKAFIDSTNESELTRLQQIHVAVESNPKLLTRLRSLDGLLANLDADDKAKLNPDGEFASDWMQQITVLAEDKHAGDVTYEFPVDVLVNRGTHGPPVVVNGHEFEAFLDKASGQDWGNNDQYKQFINGSDRTTRRLFKTLALAERTMRDDSAELNSSILAIAKEMLVPARAHKEERGRPPERPSSKPGDKEREAEREKMRQQLKPVSANWQAVKLLEFGLKKIEDNFLSESNRETVAPKVFTENFKRSEQIKLMSMAPADATQELNSRLIKANKVQNPEIAKITLMVTEAKGQLSNRSRELMMQFHQIGKNYFGGSWRGSRGRENDGRSGDGRGPGGPEDRRPGAERSGAERSGGGRGPSGRGPSGRGLGGPRFDQDRDTDNRADSRSQGDRGLNSKPPSPDTSPSQSSKK